LSLTIGNHSHDTFCDKIRIPGIFADGVGKKVDSPGKLSEGKNSVCGPPVSVYDGAGIKVHLNADRLVRQNTFGEASGRPGIGEIYLFRISGVSA
jgi:hypothetical protein